MNSIAAYFEHKIKNNFIIPCALFLSCFLLSFIAGSLIIQPQASRAVDGLGLIGPATMNLVSSTNSINLGTITPTPAGTFFSDSHTLTTSTNVPTGYQLSLTAGSTSLPVVSGTPTAPSALANNTWGYSLTGGTDTPIWAGPTATPTIIRNTTTSTTGDNITVHYGIKADTSLAADSYFNTVRYTATANIANIPAPNIVSIAPSSGTTAGGTDIKIVGTGFTVNGQSITTQVTIDGQACASISISSNTPTTGQDTIYCTTPAHPTAEAVTVAVTTWESTTTEVNGYTYIAPTPAIKAPSVNQILSAGTTGTMLLVDTNMDAICYYGTATSPTVQMAVTGSNVHTQSLTGLTDASTNTVYVRCQAAAGHSYGNETSVTFYVKAATPAAPTLGPANGATVAIGTTTITATSSGVTCTWGTSASTTTNASGTTRTTTAGTNTLYYSCIAGSGNTASDARTGSWSYTGQSPTAVTGDAIQTVTTARCPTTRTRVYDARDNATYWIQKLADGKCWMLTNLAYGGGGTNTYGDVKNIRLNSTSSGATYTSPEYYIPPGSNRTTGTTDPSTSTDGTGQHGYLYNWCAAMGAQTTTSACANAATPEPNTSISICPSGWRLPTSGSGGEFAAMTTAIGATHDEAGSTALRSTWLGTYSGYWYTGFDYQGSYGYFWSASQYSATAAYNLGFSSSGVSPLNGSTKNYGFAVRCVIETPPAKTGDHIQTVNIDNCPSIRTRVNDARDGATYWIQKLADGRCWMLTNLAYGGGGTNTYGDVKNINLNSTNTGATYTSPEYYIPTGSNRTTGTTNPSTSTDGTGQYGYLYNWCAAMGAQTSTSACANATTPAPNTSISICPSGWRLPTSSTGEEFQQMTDAIGATTNGSSGGTAGSAVMRSTWLGMYSGRWSSGFFNQDGYGYFWSASQYSAADAYFLGFGSSNVIPSNNNVKSSGFAIRCVAL